jgi:hypothetical protein
MKTSVIRILLFLCGSLLIGLGFINRYWPLIAVGFSCLLIADSRAINNSFSGRQIPGGIRERRE